MRRTDVDDYKVITKVIPKIKPEEEIYNLDEKDVEILPEGSIKYELNLIEFPIFSKDRTVKENTSKKYVFSEKKNEYLKITPSNDEDELSNKILQEFDEQIFYALLRIYEETGSRKIVSSYPNLLKIAHIQYSTPYVLRVKDSLERMKGCSITFNKCFFHKNNNTKLIDTKRVNLLSTLRTIKVNDEDSQNYIKEFERHGNIKEIFVATLNEDIVKNLNNKLHKYFQIEDLTEIRNATARKLYIMLTKWKYWDKKVPLRRTTKFLASRIPLSWKKSNIPKTIMSLEKACNELIKLGKISDYKVNREDGLSSSSIDFYFSISNSILEKVNSKVGVEETGHEKMEIIDIEETEVVKEPADSSWRTNKKTFILKKAGGEMVKNKVTRRSFVKTAAAATAIAAAPLYVPKSAFGANDRIRMAVLGVHGRGKSHIKGFQPLENVEIVTLCDPDKNVLQERAKSFQETYGKKVKIEQDLRKVLDDKKIDAVSIASTNHWHSLSTIWACQAGKDVYVEKPMSHNIFEGRKAVEAARKYNRIVQHGTQRRASDGFAKEVVAVQSGKYGKLLATKGYCCKPRWSIGFKPYKPVPQHLNFDIWLGPAKQQPYHENLVHYNWHWFWDTGNGDIGNQGVHQLDVARWAIPGATLPTKIWSLGGRYGYKDQGETANTQMFVCEYGDIPLIFEVRGLVGRESKDVRDVSNEYFTTEGRIKNRKFYPKNGGAPEPLEDLGGSVEPGGIFGNFINAVRSRDVNELNADVLEGHYSSALNHLANISLRLGSQVPFSKKPKAILENEYIFDTFQALEKNLAWGLGLDLHDMTYQMGRTLEFDPENEKFINDEQADNMLTRAYRKPYVVPKVV